MTKWEPKSSNAPCHTCGRPKPTKDGYSEEKAYYQMYILNQPGHPTILVDLMNGTQKIISELPAVVGRPSPVGKSSWTIAEFAYLCECGHRFGNHTPSGECVGDNYLGCDNGCPGFKDTGRDATY